VTNSNTEQSGENPGEASANTGTDQSVSSAAAPQSEQGETASKPRGRKLRTPFRRRRSALSAARRRFGSNISKRVGVVLNGSKKPHLLLVIHGCDTFVSILMSIIINER
jgi:hypothetical protein